MNAQELRGYRHDPAEKGKAFEFLSDLLLNQAPDPLAKTIKKALPHECSRRRACLTFVSPTWS